MLSLELAPDGTLLLLTSNELVQNLQKISSDGQFLWEVDIVERSLCSKDGYALNEFGIVDINVAPDGSIYGIAVATIFRDSSQSYSPDSATEKYRSTSHAIIFYQHEGNIVITRSQIRYLDVLIQWAKACRYQTSLSWC